MSGNYKNTVQIARKTLIPKERRVQVTEGELSKYLHVTRRGVGPIHTPYGYFWQYDFHIDDKWGKYSVLVRAQVDKEYNPIFLNNELLLRIDSGCETGQLFHDNTCECREQLHEALKKINEHGEGMIIHVPSQDGRGGGLAFKLATLLLEKDLGLNTVEAARILANNEEIDLRTYGGVVGILKFFRAKRNILLMTNNPHKISTLKENRYKILRTSILIPPTRFTKKHLRAKKIELGHLLP
ncbi:hypothetical protein KGM48_03110 [Patescibacteria group bacterium]|nr:hypothetical protein [Patescibacteria group bacterium]